MLWKLGIYFAEAGAFVFGSGLAIVPFLHGGVVAHYGWLTELQFLDAVAVAMITPGPVVITVAFIGFLVAGLGGAAAAAVGVFLPCYLFVVIPAPYFHRVADHRSIKAFVDGVSAAAAGAIGGAAIVLGRRAIIDIRQRTPPPHGDGRLHANGSHSSPRRGGLRSTRSTNPIHRVSSAGANDRRAAGPQWRCAW